MNSMINPIYPKPVAGQTDQRLTVDNTAGGVQFTAYDTVNVQCVMFDIQTADVMCTVDGSAPTTTNGHQLVALEKYTWATSMFNAAKFIRLTGTSGVIHASPLGI